MAPRKKNTKQRKDTTKMVKLAAFLQDFDSEVKIRMEQMKEQLNHLLKDVDNSYNMALLKLPKVVRQMNWLEHCKSEKPKTPEVDSAKGQEEAAAVGAIVAEDHEAVLKTIKKTLSKKKEGAKSSLEDEKTPGKTRKGRATKKPSATSKRAKALRISNQSTAIRRSSRKPLVTPAKSILDASLMGPTPLITPRFDPRLPKTPAVRVPRHNERIFSISMNGSPIATRSQDIVISVPVGNGESIQLLADQMDLVDRSLLDETALRNLRLLQNRLTTFL
ncbi:borealin [Pholidichthys leucotaenia]